MSVQKLADTQRVGQHLFACCLLCMAALFAQSETHAGTSTQAGLSRIEDSASSDNSRAIQQLNTLYNNRYSSADLEEKRALLIALISLNLRENQFASVQKLNDELSQLGAQYQDDWSKVMALNFQAAMYTRQGQSDQASRIANEERMLAAELFAGEQLHSLTELKSNYENTLRTMQSELQAQKDYQQGIEQNNSQLRQTIYVLSMIVAVSLGLLSAFLVRRIRAANRQLFEANLKLEIQSLRDPLTGLLTRHAFHDSMKARMKVVDRRFNDLNQPPHALALLDIDHFKLINDKYGHAVGDHVLIEVSNRLSQIMRENDKLMRWSGEEFLLFLNNVTTENLERIIQRVLSVVGGTAIKVGDKVLHVTLSVGYISLAHGQDSDVDEHWEKSLKLADAALYKAKINGRNQAVGIPNNSIDFQDLDAMLTINLDDLTSQEKIVVSKITGPLQRVVNNHLAMEY